MVTDYKIYAINAFLTEKYCCGDDEQYSGQKHRMLIEKAQFGDQKWHKLREVLHEVTDEKIE